MRRFVPSGEPFPDEVRQLALKRCGGLCQCTNIACTARDHWQEYGMLRIRPNRLARCPARVKDAMDWARRWLKLEPRYRFVYKVPAAKGGRSTLDNCQVLCVACFLSHLEQRQGARPSRLR